MLWLLFFNRVSLRKSLRINKRATPKWVTKSCDNRYDEVCGWNSLRDMTSSLVYLPILGKFDLDLWPWPLTLTKCQGHRHLGYWMHLIGLYLCTKYEVFRWNSLRDMTSSLVLYPFFFLNLTLTFDLDPRSSALESLNAPYWVVPWYQVWSL